MTEDKVLNTMIGVEDLATLTDVINKLSGNKELLSWFVTINKILSTGSINADLVYKIIDRDKNKLKQHGICSGMDTYKLMHFIPIVINTIYYLKENTSMFRDLELKVLSRV